MPQCVNVSERLSGRGKHTKSHGPFISQLAKEVLPSPLPCITEVCCGRYHRDRYLDQHQTEKNETEVKDVDRIRITKVYASCPGAAFWVVIRVLQSDINICYNPPVFISPLINEDLPGRAAALGYLSLWWEPPSSQTNYM